MLWLVVSATQAMSLRPKFGSQYNIQEIRFTVLLVKLFITQQDGMYQQVENVWYCCSSWATLPVNALILSQSHMNVCMSIKSLQTLLPTEAATFWISTIFSCCFCAKLVKVTPILSWKAQHLTKTVSLSSSCFYSCEFL